MKHHPLSQIIRYIAPYKIRVFLATLSSILNKLCDIVPEILIGIAIEVVLHKEHSLVARVTGVLDPYHQLYWVAALTALLWILESVFEYCYLILWRSIAQDVQHDMRLATYAHVQKLDTAYFEDKTSGGLLALISDDVNQLEHFLSDAPNAILQLVVNVIVMGGVFAYLSPMLAVLTLLPVPFVIAIAYYFQNRLAVLYESVRGRVESLSSHIVGRLSGITTIKSYTTEEAELASLSAESKLYRQVNHTASHVNAAYVPVVRMGVLSGFIMSLVIGGQYALQGTLAISFYSVLVFLTQRFLWPFTTVTTLTDMYERAMASMRRIFALLDQKQTIIDGTQNLDVHAIKGSIQFDNVSFAYNNGTRVFSGVSLDIPAQSTVAFVGTTGSGKSTIIKLLLRLYDSASGKILLDGINIKTVKLKQLRQAMALVSQEIYLTSGTVADNIAYGSHNVTHDMIVHAATVAQAHDFIKQLPNGYATLVGENGKNLSGGQRQRISIARAILKNPQILIFDEATSALDNETEAAIQRSMAELAHHHTMIVIAHRLSMVRHADIIFVLEKGEIIESGTHDQLVQKNGTYATLWKIQTGEIV